MPQFALNTSAARTDGATHSFYSLDTFARGYVEAMFFTNGDIGDEKRPYLLNDWGVQCLTVAAVDKIKADCAKFLGTLMPDGCFVRQWIDRLTEAEARPRYGDGCSDDTRAGHFFWYARQGHGVAWTDDYSSDDAMHDIADGLQDACRAFGQCEVEAYRRKIHVR